jgi:thiol-disulfide isomerase/thioredoxin
MNSNNYNLIHLTSNDFEIGQGSKGPSLTIKYPELIFVMFHADASRCPHCEELLPEFKKLPYIISGCKFALVNLNRYPDIVRLSNNTTTPLEYVPYLVLYINGKPFIRYEGDKNLQSLAEFVSEFITRLKSQSNFISTQKSTKLENEIPPYSIAIPYSVVCDDDKGVCYLKYDEAYKKKK